MYHTGCSTLSFAVFSFSFLIETYYKTPAPFKVTTNSLCGCGAVKNSFGPFFVLFHFCDTSAAKLRILKWSAWSKFAMFMKPQENLWFLHTCYSCALFIFEFCCSSSCWICLWSNDFEVSRGWFSFLVLVDVEDDRGRDREILNQHLDTISVFILFLFVLFVEIDFFLRLRCRWE